MAVLLDRYRTTAKLRHPSWRIYKAIEDIHKAAESPDDVTDLTPETFGLRSDIEIYYPYLSNDELTDEIIFALTEDDYKDNKYFCIGDCMNLFCDTKARQLVEGMILSGILPVDIASDLGYKPALIETYAQVFFDTSVWRTAADRIAYLARGVVGEDSRIKNLVMDKGIEYVMVNEFKLPGKVKMEKALATLFGKAYKQTMQFIESDDNLDQKTAQEWVKRSLEIFRELKSASRSEGGIRELTIALETHSAPTKSIEDLK